MNCIGSLGSGWSGSVLDDLADPDDREADDGDGLPRIVEGSEDGEHDEAEPDGLGGHEAPADPVEVPPVVVHRPDATVRLRSTPMPARPLRRCTIPGCGDRPAPGRSRCPDHERSTDAARGSPAARGYDARWRGISARYLARHPFCVDCGQPATTPDHDPVPRRVLVAQGVPDPDADQYLRARCTPCHSRKTVAVDGGLGRPVGAG